MDKDDNPTDYPFAWLGRMLLDPGIEAMLIWGEHEKNKGAENVHAGRI